VTVVGKKKKQQNMKFLIEECDRNVRAALVVDERLLLDFENEEAPPARIRYGKTDIDKLLESANFWSSKDSRYGGPAGWLDFYAKCRQKEVTEQILDIRKAIKRLGAAMQCVRLTHEAKKKLKNS
jgi:hypothetical protein